MPIPEREEQLLRALERIKAGAPAWGEDLSWKIANDALRAYANDVNDGERAARREDVVRLLGGSNAR